MKKVGLHYDNQNSYEFTKMQDQKKKQQIYQHILINFMWIVFELVRLNDGEVYKQEASPNREAFFDFGNSRFFKTQTSRTTTEFINSMTKIPGKTETNPAKSVN